MKKYLLPVLMMSIFLPLFCAEQVQPSKQYLLDQVIDNAWSAVRYKCMVLREVEKLLPADINRNIAQWLLRLKFFRSLGIAQDRFFRQLLSFCVAPSLYKEQEWKLPYIYVSRSDDSAYYLVCANIESKHYTKIYDAQDKHKKEIRMVEGWWEQSFTNKSILLMRPYSQDEPLLFFYDFIQGKKCDCMGKYCIAINDDETLIAGVRDGKLYVQEIPTFDSDADEAISVSSMGYEGDVRFIEFTSKGTIVVGFENGSMQLLTRDKGSSCGLKVGATYSDVIPQGPCVSCHRVVDDADEYIVNTGVLRNEHNSAGIRITDDGVQQQFFIKSVGVWDYLGEKTLLGVDAEQKNFLILNYAGEKICTGDKIAIGGGRYLKGTALYTAHTHKEDNGWVAAIARVMCDENGNGIGFEKKYMEKVQAFPGSLMVNQQKRLLLAAMRQPEHSYGVYDFAGNELLLLNGTKRAAFHPNGCSILCEDVNNTRKKIPLYPQEKKKHFKSMVQECNTSQYFALEAVYDEAKKL